MSSDCISITINMNDPFPTILPEDPYVLVIDDDPAILSVVLLLFETEGYSAIGLLESRRVHDFFEYVRVTTHNRRLPAVLLLDLMMPVVSGYDIAAQLSQQPATSVLPIVIMTADYRVNNAKIVPGARDLLNKPFQIMTLLSKVEPYLLPSKSSGVEVSQPKAFPLSC